jgi:hypothetical protein
VGLPGKGTQETRHFGLPESTSDRVRYRSGRVGASLEDDSHPYKPELGSTVQGLERRVGLQPHRSPI